VTPLGREVEQQRAQLPPPPPPSGRSPRAYGQSVGLCRLSWPRAVLVNRVARELCRQVVRRWISKDSEPVREAVQAWVADLWANGEFGPEGLIADLQDACTKALKRTPESAFDALVEPFGPGADAKPGFLAGLSDALKQMEKVVGRPEEILGSNAALPEALEKSATRLISQWGQRLAELAVRLMERPEYRLAGAEEALRQV